MATRKKTTRVATTKTKKGKRPARAKAAPPEELEQEAQFPVLTDSEDGESEVAADDVESDEDEVVSEAPAGAEPVEEAAEETREIPVEPALQADATRLYLKEIGFSPLLSAEEEVYFSRRARKG